jgi:hypothetical protein
VARSRQRSEINAQLKTHQAAGYHRAGRAALVLSRLARDVDLVVSSSLQATLTTGIVKHAETQAS